MTRAEVEKICKEYGITARKRWGQNFLCAPNTVRRIIQASGVTSEDFVLEIGPGIGALTEVLCQAARCVLCVEIDPILAHFLAERFSTFDSFHLLNTDFLGTFPQSIQMQYGLPDIVVSNLPYNQTTPILLKLLSDYPNARKMTFTVEDDACKRIFALPSTKEYGALSILSSVFGEKKKNFIIPRNHFFPVPHTTSAVISFLKNSDPEIPSPDFIDFVQASLSMRRKTLLNSLLSIPELINQHVRIQSTLDSLGILPSVRAEALTPKQFYCLFRALFLDF